MARPASRRRKMSTKQTLLCSLPPVSSQIRGDVQAVQARWREWDAEYGLLFRLQTEHLTWEDEKLLESMSAYELDELHRARLAPEPPGFWPEHES